MRILFLLMLLPHLAAGQLSVKDSSIRMASVNVQLGAQLPAANMADRFGFSTTIGTAVRYKFKNNLDLGLEYDFQFGSQVREDSLFQNLKTPQGYVISTNGIISSILVQQRGHSARVTAAWLWPVFGPNPNSGLLFRLGAGYYTHKIRIEHREDPIPALEGEYMKGYDRLAGGLHLTQFIGFHHIHNRRLINFYAGITAWQGFTTPLRSYQYDLEGPEPVQQRLDLNFGIQAGWIIPIYKRAPTGY
jgi:hypothetical protein